MSTSTAEPETDVYAELAPIEVNWRDRQQYLESRGYMLRRRYHPDWQPSWRSNPSVRARHAEDSLSTHVSVFNLQHLIAPLSLFLDVAV